MLGKYNNAGDGDGDGYGYGYGSGYGSGDGYGSGYGSGDGSGSGSGSGYWRIAALAVIKSWHSIQGTVALWWSDKNGQPSNGGNAPPVKVGDIQEIKEPLEICTERSLHATLRPEKWKGERLWIVALHGEVQRQEDKLGALKREILAEIPMNPRSITT